MNTTVKADKTVLNHVDSEIIYGMFKLPSNERREDMGPKKPEGFPHFFEAGTKVFHRKGEIRPFDRVFRQPDKVILRSDSKRPSSLNPMSYKLPDLWDHVTAPKNLKKKATVSMDNKVSRFQECEEESLVKEAKKSNSVKKYNPTIDSRAYTPFPLLSEVRLLGGRYGDTTPLGGKAISQRNLLDSSLTVHMKEGQFTPVGAPTSTPQSKAPGFPFSKTSSVKTQWAAPACLRDVTYKRVCVGIGPGSSFILPVHRENAEEELAALIVQLRLPQKEASISRSWAQTQFIADRDQNLQLSGSASNFSRIISTSSAHRTGVVGVFVLSRKSQDFNYISF